MEGTKTHNRKLGLVFGSDGGLYLKLRAEYSGECYMVFNSDNDFYEWLEKQNDKVKFRLSFSEKEDKDVYKNLSPSESKRLAIARREIANKCHHLNKMKTLQ